MEKGKLLIILPSDCELPPLDNFTLPPELSDVLDDKINIIMLPRGGSIFIGEEANELIDEFYKRLGEVKNGVE